MRCMVQNDIASIVKAFCGIMVLIALFAPTVVAQTQSQLTLKTPEACESTCRLAEQGGLASYQECYDACINNPSYCAEPFGLPDTFYDVNFVAEQDGQSRFVFEDVVPGFVPNKAYLGGFYLSEDYEYTVILNNYTLLYETRGSGAGAPNPSVYSSALPAPQRGETQAEAIERLQSDKFRGGTNRFEIIIKDASGVRAGESVAAFSSRTCIPPAEVPEFSQIAIIGVFILSAVCIIASRR